MVYVFYISYISCKTCTFSSLLLDSIIVFISFYVISFIPINLKLFDSFIIVGFLSLSAGQMMFLK